MRRITALWESFFSKSLYADAFYSWSGIGFLTLLLLAFIHSVVIIGFIQTGVQGFVKNDMPSLVEQFPAITFKDGKASTPEAKEYQIKSPKGKTPIMIIDTRIAHPPADLGGAEIFVAGESTTMNKDETQKQTFNYHSLENVTIDQKMINSWLEFLVKWLAAVCIPFIFGFFTIWFLIQLLVFSLITLIFSSTKELHGSYAATLRLTAIAMVPALVVEIILSLTGLGFFGSSLITSAIVIAYIFFGVSAAKESAEPEHTDLPPPLA